MRRMMCVILFCTVGFSSVLAQDRIQGTYVYTYGDSESLVEARQACKELAIREAIESYAVFIESSTQVEDFQVKEDLIQSISAGYVKQVSILEQKEEGRTITITVQAYVDPEEVEELMESWMERSKTPDGSADEKEANPPGGAFSDAMDRYEEKNKGIESSWKNREYDGALEQIQQIRKWLESHPPDTQNRFQQTLYANFSTRTLLQQDLVRVDKLNSMGSPIRARANMRLARRRADMLHEQSSRLMEMKSLTEKQDRIRNYCVRQNRALIDLTMRKARMMRVQ